MFTVKFKVKKVEEYNVDGVMVRKFVPLRKKALFGIGFWRECPEWEDAAKRLAEDAFLGMSSDSTLTHIRKFIDKNDPNPKNEFYH